MVLIVLTGMSHEVSHSLRAFFKHLQTYLPIQANIFCIDSYQFDCLNSSGCYDRGSQRKHVRKSTPLFFDKKDIFLTSFVWNISGNNGFTRIRIWLLTVWKFFRMEKATKIPVQSKLQRKRSQICWPHFARIGRIANLHPSGIRSPDLHYQSVHQSVWCLN